MRIKPEKLGRKTSLQRYYELNERCVNSVLFLATHKHFVPLAIIFNIIGEGGVPVGSNTFGDGVAGAFLTF